MSKDSLATTLDQWEQLLAPWRLDPEELDYLDLTNQLTELQDLSQRVKRLSEEQAALDARKQQVTRDLDEAKERGREIAVRIRNGLRSRYGRSSEKLTLFGLRPRRGRNSPPPGDL
jgi:chromosome segregation ATPase